jgi:hypothetical protein
MAGTLTPPVATEGQPLNGVVLFHFTDADPNGTASDYVATVTWGDGSNVEHVQVVANPSGGFDVKGSHTYLEEATGLTFTVMVQDTGGAPAISSSMSFNVADAGLTAVLLTPPSNPVNVPNTNVVLLHFTDADPNGTVSDYVATVTWGDGSVETSMANPADVQVVANPTGGFDVKGSHTYTVSATGLTFTVAVQDAGSASTSASTQINASGDFVLNGTPANDTLVLTSAGPRAVTYVLNGGTAVTQTNLNSFTFNGLGGNDSMTVSEANGTLQLPGFIRFDGGTGSNSLTINGASSGLSSVLRTNPGLVNADGENIPYSNTQSITINNAAAVNAEVGPNTAARSTAFNGLNAQERAVQALYLAALGRAGSKPELDGWTGLLPAGATALTQTIVSAIENSGEGRDHLVKSWYIAYLGRQANGTEEQAFVNLLGSGQTEEQVLSVILSSNEFFDRAQALIPTGTAQERYVQALYLLLLNRSAAPGELAGWVGIANASGEQVVAFDLLQSTEFRGHQFDGYYDVLLHRPSEASGLNGWIFSNIDMRSVRFGFEGTSEFFLNG